ncbi:MAG: LON peptidase substrate-binding domain-containing protein, partial [Candidatus Hydrogenedentes bacterium]|nr:LON peptidase substrate-binding domain-containing protein [Candidatus Hydrogenedentota bacterium]
MVAKNKKQPEANAEYPSALPLLTLADQVVFPGSAVPLRVANPSEQQLINDVAGGSELLALVTLKEGTGADFKLHEAHEVGCIGRLLQIQTLPDNSVTVIIQCLQRFRIKGLKSRAPYATVFIETLETIQRKRKDFKPLVTTLKAQASRLIALSPNIPDGAANIIDSISDPAFLSDLVAGNLNVGLAEKQELLSLIDLEKRLNRLMYLMEREIEVMETSAKIQQDVKDTIDKGQREYFLREQLKAIQQELGESGSNRPEIEEYEGKIAALGLSEEVDKEIQRELNRLSQMQESSAEYHMLTTYLDWVVDLPWSVSTGERLKIDRAEEILDEDHYGLEKVKRRILEHLAVRKLKKDAGGAVLCFSGPPGVGKTSLGKSIARSLNRDFVRISLGGMRDEAEIRGHRRTYVGAMPGRIIQSLRKAGSNNPVFLLDEVDKLGADFRGDPS